MSKCLSKLCLLIILMLAVAAGNRHGLAASQTAQPSGITVSPAFQQVIIQPGEAQQPISFRITNDKTTSQALVLSTADFNTLSESGGLFFVGTNPTELQKKYGLAKWLSLPQKQVTLQPKQTITISGAILNLPDLAPGGHYGALLLALQNSPSATSSNSIAVHPIASSLLFATKLDGDTHKLYLSNVYLDRKLLNLPTSVTLRFRNDGNTHVIPRGVVTITSPSGKLVSRGIINESSGIILPEVYRQYAVPLQTIASANTPGKYKLQVDFRFDGISQYRTYRQSLFLAPIGELLIAVGLCLAALVVVLIRGKKLKLNKS